MKRLGITPRSSLPELAQAKAVSSAELFANDGSFLAKFKQMQESMKSMLNMFRALLNVLPSRHS